MMTAYARARPRVVLVGGPDVDLRLELMDRLREDFELVAVGSEPALAERFAVRGYPYRCYRLERRFDLFADLRSVFELRRLLRALRPALVHAFDTKPAIVARFGAWLAGVPVIVATLPGLGGLYTSSSPQTLRRRRTFERLHRLAARFSQTTVFQNRDDLEEFVGRGVVLRAKSLLIPGSGVARARFDAVALDPARRAEARSRLGLADDAEVVVLVTRLLRSKGVLDLVAAGPLLTARRPHARVLVAGPEDPAAVDALSLEELAAVQRHATWLGPRTDIAELLAAADVFVFPSTYREGVPRVLAEAAFAGVPIVAADVVGSREVIEHEVSGLLVAPHRPELLSAAIERLLADRGLAAGLAAVARERALARFELGAIAEQHRQLWRRLLGAPPKRWFGLEDEAHALRLEQRYRQTRSLLDRAGLGALDRLAVLDVGCGDGVFLLELVQWGAEPARLAGVDLDPDAIATARRRLPAADLRVGCASRLPWDDGRFDLVVQNTVMSSMLDPVLRRAVAAEMARVLAPGGAISSYDTRRANPRNPAVAPLGAAEIAALFPGFTVEIGALTLLPHRARQLPPRLLELSYALLASVPGWRSHLLALLRRTSA